MPATPAWIAALEALLNRGIEASSTAVDLARRLEGTAIVVASPGILAVRVGVAGGRFALSTVTAQPQSAQFPAADAAAAQATLTGSPLALAQLARGGATPGRDSVTISGDAEVANRYRQLLAAARPDLEEELSRVTGDLAARRLTRLAHTAFEWAGRARRTVGANIAEYLQEESRDVVNNTELEEFLHGVDAVREATDRIEARIARLEPHPKAAP